MQPHFLFFNGGERTRAATAAAAPDSNSSPERIRSSVDWVVIDVTLSKTKKKGRGRKEVTVNTIREVAKRYNSAYVLTFENMRNLRFKEFREQLKATSRS